MKNCITILTLCLLLLWPTAVSAEVTPETPSGETQVTMTYTPAYNLPADVPYDPDFHFDLTGQVSDQDGRPYSGRFMELHSQVKRAMTDENGRFGMRRVEQGAHTLMALDTFGAVQGTLRFRIDRTNTVDSTAVLTLPDGATELLANARVTALHLILKLDGQGNLLLVGVEAASRQTETLTKTLRDNPESPPTGLQSPVGQAAAASLLTMTALAIVMIWQRKRE